MDDLKRPTGPMISRGYAGRETKPRARDLQIPSGMNKNSSNPFSAPSLKVLKKPFVLPLDLPRRQVSGGILSMTTGRRLAVVLALIALAGLALLIAPFVVVV